MFNKKYKIMGQHQKHPQIKIRDGKTVIIYFKNKRYPTGYKLKNDIKGLGQKEFDSKTGKFKKGWGPDYKLANDNIKSQLSKYIRIVDEAYQEGLNPSSYLITKLNQENVVINTKVNYCQTTTTALVEQWVKIKESKNVYKNNKDGFVTGRTLHKHLVMYRNNQMNNLTNLRFKDILDFCKWLSKNRKYEISNIYRKSDNVTYKREVNSRTSNSSLVKLIGCFHEFLIDNKDANQNILNIIDESKMFLKSLPLPVKDKERNLEWAYNDLSEEEWAAVKEFTPLKEHDKKLLDAFKFSVCTGLRFSDLKLVCRDTIKDNELIIDCTKTETKSQGGFTRIPLNQFALNILEEYNYDMSSFLPQNQGANYRLRKIVSKIPIISNSKVQQKQYYLKDVVKTVVSKSDVISWHYARRTFCTLVAKNGGDENAITSMTGWTDSRTSKYYVNKARFSGQNSRYVNNI